VTTAVRATTDADPKGRAANAPTGETAGNEADRGQEDDHPLDAASGENRMSAVNHLALYRKSVSALFRTKRVSNRSPGKSG
jgi:hypothetical protein